MSRTVYLLALCQALMMSGNALMVTAAALVGHALAEDKSLATLPLALQFLSTMATSIPASLLMGRIGRKRGFMLATLLGMGGGALAVTAIVQGRFWLFCLAAVLLGMFNGFAIYYRFAAADNVDLEHKARAISWVMAGGVIAAVVGPNLANWGQALIADARFAGAFLFVVGLHALALLLLAFADLPRNTVAHPAHAGRPLTVIAGQPKFVAAVLCAMLGYGVMSLIMTATPLAMDHHHHAFGDTAFVIQWHVLGMFAPSFVTGHIIRRVGVVPVLWTGALLAVATLAINLLGASLWHFWSGLLILGVSWNFLFVGATVLLTETYTQEERAKTQALNDFLIYTTTALASLSAGALLQSFGWWWVNIGVIPLVAAIFLVLLWLALAGPAAREAEAVS